MSFSGRSYVSVGKKSTTSASRYPALARISKMTKRGAFIVIEGLDRSGKSTQAATLLKRLQDAQSPAKLINFPGQHTHSLQRDPRPRRCQ